jgi:glycosyltransferase involved in cell wall biosynthesis
VAPAEGPLADALSAAGVPLFGFSYRGDDGRRQPLALLRAELATLLRRLRPDLLHANSLSMGRLAGPVTAELGIPSVAHLRDIIGLSAAARADLAQVDTLLAVSAATRTYHVNQGLPAERVTVLHNGVDLDQFRPRPATGWLRQSLGLPPAAVVVGCIGQIVLRKGQDVLAYAAMRLVGDAPHVHYVIAGERYSVKQEALRFEADVRGAFARGRLAGNGHFLGHVSHVERLLPELDLVVHPARQEPLGRVLLEAAAAGRPIVATDVGGTAEIFPPQSAAARLVAPDDPGALAAELGPLAGDATARYELGLRARLRAEEAFDIRAAAEGLVRRYDEARHIPRSVHGQVPLTEVGP